MAGRAHVWLGRLWSVGYDTKKNTNSPPVRLLNCFLTHFLPHCIGKNRFWPEFCTWREIYKKLVVNWYFNVLYWSCNWFCLISFIVFCLFPALYRVGQCGAPGVNFGKALTGSCFFLRQSFALFTGNKKSRPGEGTCFFWLQAAAAAPGPAIECRAGFAGGNYILPRRPT